MSDGAALLAYCHEHPDDDTARLVYADWLEEQGDEVHAEFIRVQLALANLWEGHPDSHELKVRESALLRAHEKTWRSHLPRNVWSKVQFNRGLPTCFNLRAKELLEHGPSIRKLTPIETLALGDIQGKMTAVVTSGLLAGVRELNLAERTILTTKDLAALANCLDLACLRRLHVEGSNSPVDGWAALWRSPYLSNLKTLEVHWPNRYLFDGMMDPSLRFRLQRLNILYSEIEDLDGNELGRAACLGQLEELKIVGAEAEVGVGLTDLLGSPAMSQLRWLCVCDGTLDKVTIEHLLRALEPGRLQYLALQLCRFEDDSFATLLASSHFKNLLVLDLEGSEIADKEVKKIAQARSLPSLRELSLKYTDVTEKGVTVLAGSPAMRNLTRLNLKGNRVLGPQMMRAIATSEQLSALRKLDLEGNKIGPEGAAALASSTTLRSLRHLDLFDNAIGDGGARALLNSSLLGQLDYLRLERNGIRKEIRARFLKQQGGRTFVL